MTQLERSALYEEVWSEPISRLAPKYGLTGNGLKKICAKLNIPVPPRGYWAKIQHGIKTKKQPLAKLKHGEPCIHRLHLSEIRQAEKAMNINDNLAPEAQALVNRVRDESCVIAVHKKLTSPHPLVRQTHELLKTTKPDEYGVLRVFRAGCLNIRVSPECLSRALRIIDAIIKVFESLGFNISNNTVQYDRAPSTRLDAFGESIRFTLQERVKRINHIPTDEEKRKMVQWSFYSPPKWEYRPTGKLILRYDPWGHGHDGLKKIWADGTAKQLEDMVVDFVVGGIKIGAAMKRHSILREETDRFRQEELRRQKEIENQKQLEIERLKILEQQAEQWSNSQKLRDFICAVKDEFCGKTISSESREKLGKWLSWAEQHADRIDPLKNGALSIFERDLSE